MRRYLISLWIGASAAGLFAAEEPANRPARNVLFIAVDDLRPSVGCYGDARARTPHIDALAASGLVFDRAYCQQAVCSPSRTSLLTGRRPDTTKVYDLETHFRDTIPDVVTLPQHFKANGYVTRAVGKIYHGGLDDPKSWSAPSERGDAPGFGPEGQKVMARLRAEAKEAGIQNPRIRGLPTEAPDVADDELVDGAAAKRAIEILEEIKDEPFFLAVGFLKPHLPFVAPKKYWDQWSRADFPLADNQHPPHGSPEFAVHNSGELRAYVGIPMGQGLLRLPEEQQRELIHGYYAATSYMDAQVGRLLAALDEHGLRDNTVVVIWGDHGWQLGEHAMWCKHCNYETSARVPMIVSVPGQMTAGRHSAALVEFVDIYPSLCELCGLTKPEGLEGTSFAPLIAEPDRPWKRAAFSQYPRGAGGRRLMGYALRTDRFRYVEWQDRQDGRVIARELYDHSTDPDENENVADREENATTVRELAGLMKAGWRGARPAE